MCGPIKIVLADDHALFRSGVSKTLSADCRYQVVAECGNAGDAVEAVCDNRPDIALLDVNMPGGGIAAARAIATKRPKVRIIMLTASEERSDVMEAFEAGAHGYVVKGIGGKQFLQVIETIHQGGVYVAPDLATRTLIEIKHEKAIKSPDPFSKLSDRERQILEGVARGQTNKEIAALLDMNEHSVERQMTNVMRKIRVNNRLEAALKAHDYFAHR